ncbi:uncharacterized protein LOC115691408 [Syzygium oleosum]|uniref:uncharacterized protein LOC115691408 n=1 Tax=Syzygium oleosum TaxID=219896 RepID=UPI0024B8D7D4|nr:uncharacterized protein LOC115691408 [Syzygium oleosum]
MEGGGETADGVKGFGLRKRRRAGSDDRGRPEGSMRDKCRRENITELYTKLRSMIPSMCPKAPRAEILQEASLYIRFLEEERARLEMLKISSAQVTANSSSISVTLSDSNLAVFAITSSIRRNLVTDIISVFGRHRAEILAANVVAQAGWMSMTVTAAVNDVADGAIEKIKQDILMV